MPSKAIGILGGTFDPIHHGHLRLAWEASVRLNLDRLHLMPCHIPSHRDSPSVGSRHRLAMAKLACQQTPGFYVDDMELQHEQPSYTVDSLKRLRTQWGDDCRLLFIMGMDAFCHFCHWHRWRDILQLAHLWIARRPGSHLPAKGTEEYQLLETVAVTEADQLLTQAAGSIYIYDSTALDISATRLREDMAQGLEPRFLLPDTVWQYIRRNRLYNIEQPDTNQTGEAIQKP